MNDREEFEEFRDTIIMAFNEYKVPYKLFGGAVICLMDEERLTSDVDIAIPQNDELVDKVINALYSIKYCKDKEDIRKQFYGEDGDSWYGSENETTLHLATDKEEWKGLHIDLCFNLGEHNYESMPSMEFETNTIKLNIVDPIYIARMKAKIYPKPRDKDIKDIIIIKKYLGIDEDKKEKEKEKSNSLLEKLFKKGTDKSKKRKR